MVNHAKKSGKLLLEQTFNCDLLLQILKETGLHPADDSGAPGMDSYSGSGGAGKSSYNIKEQSGGGVAGSSGSGETSSSGDGGSPEPKSKASRQLLSAFQA